VICLNPEEGNKSVTISFYDQHEKAVSEKLMVLLFSLGHKHF